MREAGARLHALVEKDDPESMHVNVNVGNLFLFSATINSHRLNAKNQSICN